MSIRIGGVPYGVGAPLLCGLSDDPGVELSADHPARLVGGLRGGALDVALVSSIEAFRRPGYRVVPGIGIACRGPVRSVRAFLRAGLAVQRIRSVGLDRGSETSVALLRILLRRRLGAPDCGFERITPTLEPDALPHDLVLQIGDRGLWADPGPRRVLDLGELWHDWTGLPFVFALWLIAPGAQADAIVPRLRRAAAAAHRRGIADGTRGAVHYRIGEAELRGLARFRDEAAALALVAPGTDPIFLSDTDSEEAARPDD